MVSYQSIPILATLIFLLVMSAFVIYLIKEVLKDSENEIKFNHQLKVNLNPQAETSSKENNSEGLLYLLPNALLKSEVVNNKKNNVEDVKRLLNLILALVFTMATFFLRNPIGGIVASSFLYIGLLSISMYRVSKVKNVMNEQIPAFVSTFKANIQANQHAQNAMVRAIDSTASPLYDELEYAKSIMEAGDFRPGIVALRMSTENDTLRQMASCIELASESGSNIEPQIEIIEEIIESKQSMERLKKLGVNENKPLFLVSALFIPISFVGSYVMSEMHRDFWFNSTLSWFILLGVLVVSSISIAATWKIIQNVDIK